MEPFIPFVAIAIFMLVLNVIRMPATLRNSVVIDRPIDVVFSFISEPTNIPIWSTHVSNVRLLTERPVEEGARWTFAVGTVELTYQIMRLEPPSLMVVEGHGPRMSNSVEYRLVPRGGATELALIMKSRVPAIQALVIGVIGGTRSNSDLIRLKTTLES